MNINGRHLKIIKYVNQREIATVKELSDEFDVSRQTIRRDLSVLVEKKILERYHGGVRKPMTISEVVMTKDFDTKINSNMDEKNKIGLKAAEFIKDDDIVFMNGGTTVLSFLKSVSGRNITVVTNNAAALECTLNPGIDLLILGGTYQMKLKSFVGELTIANIRCIYSNCTILGTNGLDPVNGMTTSVFQECSINNAMIDHSRGKVVLLADHTKMGLVSNYVSSPLNKINVIITDSKCPAEFITAFKEQGIEVILT